MAAFKVINEANEYHDLYSFQNVIHYITSPDKTAPDGVIGGAVLPEIAVTAMESVVSTFHKEDGLKLRHCVLSFSPNEPIFPLDAKEVARECVKYYEKDYQIVAAVHEDCDHLHIHFAMNTTSYRDGHKYHGDRKDFHGFLGHIHKALAQYGVSVYPTK